MRPHAFPGIGVKHPQLTNCSHQVALAGLQDGSIRDVARRAQGLACFGIYIYIYACVCMFFMRVSIIGINKYMNEYI